MIRVKYKIEGEKPDLMRILNNMSDEEYNIYEEEGILYLTIALKDEILQKMRKLIQVQGN